MLADLEAVRVEEDQPRALVLSCDFRLVVAWLAHLIAPGL